MENNSLADVEYERHVLGHGIDRPENLDIVLSDCPAEYFYLDSHRKIWHAIRAMADRGAVVDIATVIDELGRLTLLSSVGGAAYISELTTGAARHERSLVAKIEKLGALRMKRQLLAACNIAMSTVTEPGGELSEATAGLDRALREITAGDRGKSLRRVDGFANAALNELFDPPPKAAPLTTGIWPLDQATSGGIRPGHYWVIGGMPGRGKTSIARQAILANTLRGVPCLVFSIEMSAESWVQHSAATIAKVPASKLYGTGSIWETERAAMREAAEAFGKSMYIDDSSPLEISELVARARMAIRRDGIRMVVVDYLQLISAPPKEIRERVTYVSNALRELAKSEKVSVMALSQLARPKSIHDLPTMTSLKESGDVEAHAMTIVLIHTPEEEGAPTGEDLLLVAKQRFGPRGPVPVSYNRDFLTFARREGTSPPPEDPASAGPRRVL